MDPKTSPLNDVPVPDLPTSGGPVPLNQPFPKEVANAPMVDIAEQVGQKIVEKEVAQKPADANRAADIGAGVIAGAVAAESKPASPLTPDTSPPPITDQPKTNEQSGDDSKKDNDGKIIGGYAAADLLKAPVTPPEPKQTDGKKATSNPIVKTLVAIGIVLGVLGLIFLFFVNTFFGIILMLLGCAAIVACVFLPVGLRSKKQNQKQSEQKEKPKETTGPEETKVS